jgi:folate-binding protein YgfZ
MFTDLYKSDNVPLTESFGVSYPDHFTDPASEYEALTTAAGLIDLCHWDVLALGGDDRVRLLNALTTNDVESLSPGRGCHSAMTTVKGKLVAELYVFRRESDLLVVVAQGDGERVAAAIDKHIIADDVTVENMSDRIGAIAVEGPKSREIVWRLFPHAKLPAEPLQFADADYLGIPVTIVRGNVTGESGFCFLVPGDGIARIRNYLIHSGRADDMALVGRAAWNARRVEAGLPWWGHDVSDGENFPKECRLDAVVSYNKGCYLGQETLARMHYRGHPNWLLSAVVQSGGNAGDLPPAGSEMFAPSDPSKSIGRVTSAVISPALGKPLIMGYLRTGFTDAGTRLVLRDGESERPVVVTSLPVK